jgi:hypothetical protein
MPKSVRKCKCGKSLILFGHGMAYRPCDCESNSEPDHNVPMFPIRHVPTVINRGMSFKSVGKAIHTKVVSVHRMSIPALYNVTKAMSIV